MPFKNHSNRNPSPNPIQGSKAVQPNPKKIEGPEFDSCPRKLPAKLPNLTLTLKKVVAPSSILTQDSEAVKTNSNPTKNSGPDFNSFPRQPSCQTEIIL